MALGEPDGLLSRRIGVDEYHSLADAGFFDLGPAMELLDGFAIHKEAKSPRHVTAKRRLAAWLAANTPAGCMAIIEDPITLSRSEPEADGAIVRGTVNDFTGRHPRAQEVVAIFEVADSTLERDREWKGRIYAEAGIAVYMLVNLAGEAIEVFREPTLGRYASREVIRAGESADLAFATLAADDVLRSGL